MDPIAEARAAVVTRGHSRCRACRQMTRWTPPGNLVGHTCTKDIVAADAYALAVANGVQLMAGIRNWTEYRRLLAQIEALKEATDAD